MEDILSYLRENGVSEEILSHVAQLVQTQDREHELDTQLLRAGARNLTAVKSLIDPEELDYTDGKLAGLDGILDRLRTECGYLFGGNTGYQPQTGTMPPDPSQMSDHEYFNYLKSQRK